MLRRNPFGALRQDRQALPLPGKNLHPYSKPKSAFAVLRRLFPSSESLRGCRAGEAAEGRRTAPEKAVPRDVRGCENLPMTGSCVCATGCESGSYRLDGYFQVSEPNNCENNLTKIQNVRTGNLVCLIRGLFGGFQVRACACVVDRRNKLADHRTRSTGEPTTDQQSADSR